jgi:hypothetical protein
MVIIIDFLSTSHTTLLLIALAIAICDSEAPERFWLTALDTTAPSLTVWAYVINEQHITSNNIKYLLFIMLII